MMLQSLFWIVPTVEASAHLFADGNEISRDIVRIAKAKPVGLVRTPKAEDAGQSSGVWSVASK